MQRKSILPTLVFYSLFYLDLDRKIIKNKDTQIFFLSDIGLGLIYWLMCKSFIFDLFEVQNRVLEPCI